MSERTRFDLHQTLTDQIVAAIERVSADDFRLPWHRSGMSSIQPKNAFTPVVGWNTATMITPVSLPSGSYWIAYLPSSSSLKFTANFGIGNFKATNYDFAAMPATFPTISMQGITHWSLYGTLTTP